MSRGERRVPRNDDRKWLALIIVVVLLGAVVLWYLLKAFHFV
jgi:hypothetical protein